MWHAVRRGLAPLGALVLGTLAACQAPAAPPAASPPPADQAAGVSAAQAASVPPPPLQPLKIGDARVFTGVPIYVAVEKGYFQEQGIDLQFEPITGADSAAYLSTGQLDLALDAITAGFFNAIERGADMRIIAPAGILTLEDSPLPLVVRAELVHSGAVQGPADLKGRRVAAMAPGRMTTVISASGQTLRERPDLLRGWAVAYLRGIRDLQPPQLGVWDPERLYRPEHLAIFTKYLHVPEQVLRDQVPYTWDPDLVIQGDAIMDIQRTHLRNGVLTLAQPVPLERLIAPDPSDYARAQLGRVRS